MKFHVLTIFPRWFESPLQWGVVARALKKGIIQVRVHDIRAHAPGPHRSVDDYPYGGGEGMVMKPEPLFDAVEAVRAEGAEGPVVLMSPQGVQLTMDLAREMAGLSGMILLCGRYEGVDERFRVACVEREVSIGDYILTGGELAAMVVMETVSRLVEGVLGNEDSHRKNSFEGGLLKYPQYTRPPVFRGMEVPEVLLSGNHGEIDRWRRRQSLLRTLESRPDLLERADLSRDELAFLEEIRSDRGSRRDA